MKTKFVAIITLTVILVSCTKEKVQMVVPEKPITTSSTTTVPNGTVITYNNTVRAIISQHCTPSCHTPGKWGYVVADLTSYNGVKIEVDAGTFKNRVLVQKSMPTNGSLSEDELRKLNDWINNMIPE